jgi:NAD(P)-dependent dehydrogenase (short-subunit alcohol dehydrogenase family)
MTAPSSEPQKVAIVTGASRGIGAGITTAFARAGYAVIGTSRSIRPSGEPDVLAVPGDIAEAETAQRVVEQALDRFGRIDTLINDAGIFIGKPFTDYTTDDYTAMTAVNLAAIEYAACGVRVNAVSLSRISDRAWQASFNVAAGASPFATYACVDTWLTDFRADLPNTMLFERTQAN